MMTIRDHFRAARPLRLFGIGFAASAAVLAGAQHIAAQAIASHDTTAPVNFAADHMELQDKQKRVVLSGNVDITQADLRLRAARTTLAYTDQGSLKIQRIDATGGVRVTRGNETARGDAAVYDFNKRIVTMVGNVALTRGTDTLNGGRLVIDLNSGVSSVDGTASGAAASSSGGRVMGSFRVSSQN